MEEEENAGKIPFFYGPPGDPRMDRDCTSHSGIVWVPDREIPPEQLCHRTHLRQSDLHRVVLIL